MSLVPPTRAKLPAALSGIYDCRACELSKKSHPIYPRGNFAAPTMMLGEAPGKIEEQENCFFIGPAGAELDASLKTLSVSMDENFFICNAVQCRPHPPEGVRKENRAPTTEEVAACRHNLDKIVELHQPKLIVVIGGVAAKAIMKVPPRSVGAIVGKFAGPRDHTLNCDADLYSIWHPAYILRNMERKKDWMMQLVVLRDYMKGNNLIQER